MKHDVPTADPTGTGRRVAARRRLWPDAAASRVGYGDGP